MDFATIHSRAFERIRMSKMGPAPKPPPPRETMGIQPLNEHYVKSMPRFLRAMQWYHLRAWARESTAQRLVRTRKGYYQLDGLR